MRTLIGITGMVVLIGTAAPAYADPTGDASVADGSFLSSLKQEGLSYKDGPVAISVGKKSCELMDQGHDKSQVIQSLSTDNPGFSPDNAAKFTTSAVKAYCPQHAADSNAAPPAAPAPAPTPPPPA
jgi:hypothetical protein